MSQQTLWEVPPTVFVQDKEQAAAAQVDQLSAIAPWKRRLYKTTWGPDASDTPSPCNTLGPAVRLDLGWITRCSASRSWTIRRGKSRDVGVHAGLEQVAELTKQTKRKRKANLCMGW